jgi:RNA polymerase sigma factor (sigma-70 family)
MNNPGSLLRFLRRIARPPDDEAGDGQLLARFASGRDEVSFSALVARHGPMVLGVCRRLLHDARDAEDAFQAAFLVLARKAGSLRRPEALGNWLYGVAHRTALEARARAAKRRSRESELAEEPAVKPSCDPRCGELREILDAEINRLPDKFRTPFVLCYLEGRTNDEAARLLCCPKGTILSRLATARQRLRDRLARRGLALSVTAGTVFSVDSLSAAVFAELLNSTTATARLFVEDQAVAPVAAVSLARGVLKAMYYDRIKTAAGLLLLLALLGVGLAWLGQPTQASDAREPAVPVAQAKAEKRMETLLALEKRAWEAAKNKDVATLRKTCASDFLAVYSDGTRLTLDEYCKALSLIDLKKYSLSDVRLLSLGPDAAVLIYQADTHSVVLGATLKERTQMSSIWVRRDGEWRNVFAQETPIED